MAESRAITGKLALWKPKEGISAAKLSKTNEAINRLLEGVPPPEQVLPERIAHRIQRFKIVSILANHYVCNPYDGVAAETSTSIKVARPVTHRNSVTSRNGVAFSYTTTQQRTATQGATTETQVLVPNLLVGDEIYAISNPIGGTGVTVGTELLEWLDMNFEGRAWAKQ